MKPFEHILVPTDFGAAADSALDCALALAATSNAKVTLLHATWIPPTAQGVFATAMSFPMADITRADEQGLARIVADAKKRYPQVEGLSLVAPAATAILTVIRDEKVDLVVMGTHGRRGLTRVMMGSVAEGIVRQSPVPVLTVGSDADRKKKEEAIAAL